MDLNVTDVIEGKVVKGGETHGWITFHRNQKGLSVSIRVNPLIEEFVRNMGSGESVDVRTLGRDWTPIPKDTNLLVYTIGNQAIASLKNQSFTLSYPGKPIVGYVDKGAPREDDGDRVYKDYGRQPINISFLRLVGIGEGNGVTYGIPGVYSMDAIRNMRDLATEAVEAFYKAYMKPINMTVTMNIQEIAP